MAGEKQSGFTTLEKLNINIISSQAIYYKNFAITKDSYACDSDWDAVVQQIFGNEYRVADWNDLKAYYSSTGNILELLDGLGMTNYKDNAFVTCNGQRIWSSGRYYFIERHNHNLPSYFLAHDNIDNYAVSLDSWNITTKILAIRK